MKSSRLARRRDNTWAGERERRPEGTGALPETTRSFDDEFVALFDQHFHRLYRYLDRLSGEPDLAADLVQEAFVKLHRRGSLPDAPAAWLISVAMNLFRSERSTQTRRRRLLALAANENLQANRPPSAEMVTDAADVRRRVRAAIDRLPEREGRMLLLRAEGYSYRDIAGALQLNEASVGTLLARARRAFRQNYEDAFDAP